MAWTTAHWLAFLGWSTAVHFSVLLASALFWLMARQRVAPLYARWTGVSPDQLAATYLRVLAQYKVLIWVFFAVPYGVLRFAMASATA